MKRILTILCSRKAEGFGEWVNAHTTVIPSGGVLRMETHDPDPLQDNNPCVLLLTREDAGRLGAFLVASAMSEGWEP
jgi:hypothetical protein